MLLEKHNSVRVDSDRAVSSLLESPGQAIEVSRRRKVRSNSVELRKTIKDDVYCLTASA